MNFETIGRIERLQVHLADVKLGSEPYDARRIAPVEELWLTDRGCVALYKGIFVLDAHHLDFPGPRKHAQVESRVISIGFTSHHEHIDRILASESGCDAGENVVVGSTKIFGRSDLSGGVLIQGARGQVWLRNLAVAEPCVQFTRHVTGASAEETGAIADGMRLLGRGARGFTCGLSELRKPVVIRVGDEVFRSVAGQGVLGDF